MGDWAKQICSEAIPAVAIAYAVVALFTSGVRACVEDRKEYVQRTSADTKAYVDRAAACANLCASTVVRGMDGCNCH